MQYRHVGSFAGRGAGADQFHSALRGVAADSEDRLYAVGDSEVKVFEASGNLVRHWPTRLPGWSVAVSDRAVYVGQEGRIEIYGMDGTLQDSWQDARLLGLVTAIQVLDNDVLAADARDRCIRRYDRKGSFLHNIGKDNRMKGFNIPNGALDFSVDRNSIIHACNPGKHRVERYSLEGELLGHIGRFDGRDPRGFQGCCNPTNVAVSAEGLVYVTEKASPRAKVLASTGELLAVIATDLFDPSCSNMDLTVDSRGRVCVVDTIRLEIRVFMPENTDSSPRI